MNEYQSLFELTERRALVVGAASGIGEVAAHALAAFGAEVTCADLRFEAAGEVAGAIEAEGGRADAMVLDVRDPGAVAAACRRYGAPDVLVATAGVNLRRRIIDLDEDAIDHVVDVNLKGTFRLMREFGRVMRERASGSIIAFSSVRARSSEPGQGIYAATKAGALMLVQTLAAELGEAGVRVNAIAPGVVETPLTVQIRSTPEWYEAHARKSVLNRWAKASEMAGAVVFLASDASSYVTGSYLTVDGGWLAADGRFTPPL